MLYTDNYDLNLPEKNEQFNIEHFNENTKAIDEQLKTNSDGIQKEISDRKSANNTLQKNIDNKLDKTLNNAEGVLPVSKGGTGQTTLPNAFKSMATSLSGHNSKTLVDNDEFIMSTENHEESGSWGRIHLSQIWTYIQSKISSVLGLTKTAYGGKASTAGTADTAIACSGNAATATKLATARTINIKDSSSTNTGTGASFDGNENVTIKLPGTIKANITGNCSGSSGSCTGNAATATKLATARNIQITDGTNKGTAKSFNGSGSIELPLPTMIQATKMRATSRSDVDLSSYDNDPFVIGTKTDMNIGIDQNEIQARNNGEASVLYLNNLGGDVVLGNENSLISIPGRLKTQCTYSYQKNYQYCRIELDFHHLQQIGFIKFSIWDGGCTDVAIFFNFVDRICEYYVDGKQQNITNIRYLFGFEDASNYDNNHVTIYIALVRKNYGCTYITYPSINLKWFTAEFANTSYAPPESTVANRLI